MKFCKSNTSQTRLVLNLNVYPWGEMTSRKPNKVRFGVWLRSFVSCCFACAVSGRVLELIVCWVRFARVSCQWLRFGE